MDTITDHTPQQALSKQSSGDFFNSDHVSLSGPYGGCDCKGCLGEVRDRPDRSSDRERLTVKDREAHVERGSEAKSEDVLGRYERVMGRYSMRYVKKSSNPKTHHIAWVGTWRIIYGGRPLHGNNAEVLAASREPATASRAADSAQHAGNTAVWSFAAPSTANDLYYAGLTARKEEVFDQHDSEDGRGNSVETQREEATTRRGLPARHLGQLHRLPSGAAASSADYRQPPPWCPTSPLASSGDRAWSCHEPVRSDWLRVICSDEHEEQAGESPSHDEGQVTKTDGMSSPAGRSDAEARQARDHEATRAVEDTIQKNGEVKALWAVENGEILLDREKGGEDVVIVGTENQDGTNAQAEQAVMGVEKGQMETEAVTSLGADDGDWELL